MAQFSPIQMALLSPLSPSKAENSSSEKNSSPFGTPRSPPLTSAFAFIPWADAVQSENSFSSGAHYTEPDQSVDDEDLNDQSDNDFDDPGTVRESRTSYGFRRPPVRRLTDRDFLFDGPEEPINPHNTPESPKDKDSRHVSPTGSSAEKPRELLSPSMLGSNPELLENMSRRSHASYTSDNSKAESKPRKPRKPTYLAGKEIDTSYVSSENVPPSSATHSTMDTDSVAGDSCFSTPAESSKIPRLRRDNFDKGGIGYFLSDRQKKSSIKVKPIRRRFHVRSSTRRTSLKTLTTPASEPATTSPIRTDPLRNPYHLSPYQNMEFHYVEPLRINYSGSPTPTAEKKAENSALDLESDNIVGSANKRVILPRLERCLTPLVNPQRLLSSGWFPHKVSFNERNLLVDCDEHDEETPHGRAASFSGILRVNLSVPLFLIMYVELLYFEGLDITRKSVRALWLCIRIMWRFSVIMWRLLWLPMFLLVWALAWMLSKFRFYIGAALAE